MQAYKNGGAARTAPNQNTQQQNNKALFMLQRLREEAWHQAMKYKWDPVVGELHATYLAELNAILEVVA